ncbi:hypothetical protein SI65_02868 [Aspergillus cristatus]|uniref:Uncharacterized protein n=1 Tax=Aspergillus cristatus TaxID=573508 RepID=A0A1E3BM35_ASPCR|nr:hypothetical protein SI65_02868 [Aspergillus cristatus]
MANPLSLLFSLCFSLLLILHLKASPISYYTIKMTEAARINVELTWQEMWFLVIGLFFYRMINLGYDIDTVGFVPFYSDTYKMLVCCTLALTCGGSDSREPSSWGPGQPA